MTTFSPAPPPTDFAAQEPFPARLVCLFGSERKKGMTGSEHQLVEEIETLTELLDELTGDDEPVDNMAIELLQRVLDKRRHQLALLRASGGQD